MKSTFCLIPGIATRFETFVGERSASVVNVVLADALFPDASDDVTVVTYAVFGESPVTSASCAVTSVASLTLIDALGMTTALVANSFVIHVTIADVSVMLMTCTALIVGGVTSSVVKVVSGDRLALPALSVA